MRWTTKAQVVAVVAIAVVLGVGSSGITPDAGAVTKLGCEAKVFKDYLAPLRRFPSNRGFPESGELRVGPSILRIEPPRTQLVAIGRDQFEAFGSLAHDPLRPSASLRWWVSSDLERVSRSGLVAKAVRSKSQYIEKVDDFRARAFGFASRVQPGIYRLRIRIENRAHELLAEYEEYFRAVVKQMDVRLVARPEVVPAGGVGTLGIRNYGTISATMLKTYRIWGVGGLGHEVSLPPQFFTNERAAVPPGYASMCVGLHIPSDLAPGRYWVGMEAEGFKEHRQREYLTTHITVVAPST